MIITTEQLDGVRLTPHYTVGEFLNLKKYPDNIPTFPDLVNLYFGCLLLLEPARQVAGPIIINSGFRNSRVNRLVGGVANSQVSPTRSTSSDRLPTSGRKTRHSFSAWWISSKIVSIPTNC